MEDLPQGANLHFSAMQPVISSSGMIKIDIKGKFC